VYYDQPVCQTDRVWKSAPEIVVATEEPPGTTSVDCPRRRRHLVDRHPGRSSCIRRFVL